MAWWRPPVGLALAPLFAMLIMPPVALAFVLLGQRQALDFDNELEPAAFAFTNLLLAALIPAAMLATRVAHRSGGGYLSSVAGHVRWRWLLRCVATVVPVYVVYVALDLLLDPPRTPSPAQPGLLLSIILLTTPLQAAGEEYVCRGLLVQHIGAWFGNPRVALLVSALLSTMAFTAAHGSADPWIVADLALGSLASSLLVWRTGGLEAAIVLHAANNVVGMVATVLIGGWEEGFVDANARGEPLDVLLTLLVMAVVVPLVLRTARRHDVQRTYQPGASAQDAVGSRSGVAGGVFAGTLGGVFVGMVCVAIISAPRLGPARPQLRHYSELITAVGVTADGCLRGLQLEALPIEIRTYGTRELVGDDTVITLDEEVVAGRGGVFQLPVSAQRLAANPAVRVVLPGGKAIDYRYQFLRNVTRGTPCRPDVVKGG